MSEVVAKFGGTSMARPEVVADALETATDAGVIVVSAPGKNPEAGVNEKITDQLYGYAELLNEGSSAAARLRDEIIDHYDSIYPALGTHDRQQLRDKSYGLLKSADKCDSNDAVAAIGEELSAHYFGRLIGASVLDPSWLRMTDNGQIDRSSTRQLFANEYLRIHDSGRIVIPGFYGFTEDGSKRILGRGGSDRTGALAAVSLRSLSPAVIYENWTDTDGIFSADPRIIAAAVVNPVLTRAEVREGAHGGSGILQGDTIIDLNGSDVAVHVRNTFNPDVVGTLVVPEREFDEDRPVISVTGKELGVITVQDMGMADDVGYVEAITSLVKESGLALEHMPTAQDALSMTFHTSVPDETLTQLADNIGSLTSAETASVYVHRQGVIYLVGEALRGSVKLSQVTARAAEVLLEDGGSGFETIISHPSSPSLAFLVDHHELKSGQQKLHHAFIEK